MNLTENCLDSWLGDFDAFRYDLLEFCFTLSKAVGYYFDFDQAALQVAHQSWKSECEVWQQSYIMPNSVGLSHLKIMGILAVKLAKIEWMRDLVEFEPQSETRKFKFRGTDPEKEEVRKDINAGRGTYLGYQFCIQVLNWFEGARDDRRQPFEFRMTAELDHDLMVYLLSEKRDEMAMFLIFEALYARDSKTNDAHA